METHKACQTRPCKRAAKPKVKRLTRRNSKTVKLPQLNLIMNSTRFVCCFGAVCMILFDYWIKQVPFLGKTLCEWRSFLRSFVATHGRTVNAVYTARTLAKHADGLSDEAVDTFAFHLKPVFPKARADDAASVLTRCAWLLQHSFVICPQDIVRAVVAHYRLRVPPDKDVCSWFLSSRSAVT